MIAGDKMPSSMAKVAFSPERTKVNNKELYETPSTMVLEVRQEGVICGSLTDPFLAIRETVLNMLDGPEHAGAQKLVGRGRIPERGHL